MTTFRRRTGSSSRRNGDERNAVLYCRVSTKEQVENLSLPTQERTCRDYCAREGWRVDRVFLEKGESAKTADRSQLRELLDYCQGNKGRIQAVVVYSLSRFARNSLDHLSLRLVLLKVGVTLRSATEPIDDSSTGKLLEGMLANFSQFDNDTRADRTVDGMQATLMAGKWPFQGPLGYRQPGMQHDPQKAPIIRQAFELVAAGVGREVVLQKLHALGLKTAKGLTLSKQTFHSLLANPLYMGRMVLPDWEIDVRGAFEPIVPEQLFIRVQTMLGRTRTSPKRAYSRGREDFPLRHFVRCADCGTPLTGSLSSGRNGTRYPYYRCPNAACKGVNVRRDTLHSAFYALLDRLLPKDEYLAFYSRIVLDTVKQQRAHVATERALLENRIAGLKERKNRLVDAFVYKQAISEDIYHEQLQTVEQGLALAESQKDELLSDELDVEGILNFADILIREALRLWMEAPLEQKQRMQEVLFPEGLAYSELGGFGTPVTCFAFKVLPEDWQEIEVMASPTGFAIMWTVEFSGIVRRAA